MDFSKMVRQAPGMKTGLLLAVVLGLAGCHNDSNSDSFVHNLPPPIISQLVPDAIAVGCGATGNTLTVDGTKFLPDSVVLWNNQPLVTTFVSSTQLTATIPTADLANANRISITVRDQNGTSAPHILGLSGDATTFQMNAAHTGVIETDCTVTLPTSSAWQFSLDSAPTYALIADGKVFVASKTKLYALNASSGAVVWGPISLTSRAGLAYDAGQVFVMSYVFGTSGTITALNADTGAENWATVLPGQYSFTASVTAANGMVYTGGAGTGGTVYALEQVYGGLVWISAVENGDDSTPAVSNYGVYVSYPCQTYDFDPLTGLTLWHYSGPCEGGGGATPVLANGILYSPDGVGTNGGTTFDPVHGTSLGSYTADNTPSIASTMGYFLQSRTLNGIQLSNNQVEWSFTGDGFLNTSPVTINQYTFIGSDSGKLYAVDNTTGHQAWVQDVGSSFPSNTWGQGMLTGLSIGEGMLVVPAGNGVIAYSLIAH